MDERKAQLLAKLDEGKALIRSAQAATKSLNDPQCNDALAVAQSQLDQAQAAIEKDMDLHEAERYIDNTLQEMIALAKRLAELREELDQREQE